MAFIDYLPPEQINESDRVADNDNIIQVHGVHSRVMKLHFDMYVELMHKPGPISREHREMVAVLCSIINECNY